MIRKATEDDLETIRELREAMYTELRRPEHRRNDWSEVVEDVRGYIAKDAALIAEEDGNVVGFALGWPESERVGYLGLLYVRPEWRRRGVGRALVVEAVRELERPFVTLSVDIQDNGARAFYRRLGFNEDAVELVIEAERLAEAATDRGPSFGSVHVQTDDVNAVARAACQWIARQGPTEGTIVSQPRNGWVAVYDEHCDREPQTLQRLARELSDRMGAVALAIGIERGEVIHYNLYERGRSVDEYLSVPEYYGSVPSGDVVALGANPTVVARLTGADRARFRAVARTAASVDELPPVQELLASIAAEMRIEGATHGYAQAADLPGAVRCP